MENALPTRRALVLINARSRRGADDVTAALDTLREAGLEVLALRLSSSGDVGPLIREHRTLADLVVLGGGDGTMNAGAEALVETRLPLGILPLGTANDLARSLSIPTDPRAAAAIIGQGRTRRIDLGKANDKLFFNIATMGLSAKLARTVTPELKRRFGPLAYGVAMARLGTGRPFRARISVDGETVELKAIQIAVGNGRYHGGGVVVHEEAEIDDQTLHVYALAAQGRWQLLKNLPWLVTGQHELVDGVVTLAGRTCMVTTDEPMRVNTDGELTTMTPVRFEVVPQALEVFVAA